MGASRWCWRWVRKAALGDFVAVPGDMERPEEERAPYYQSLSLAQVWVLNKASSLQAIDTRWLMTCVDEWGADPDPGSKSHCRALLCLAHPGQHQDRVQIHHQIHSLPFWKPPQ